jgi:hypothetical protein
MRLCARGEAPFIFPHEPKAARSVAKGARQSGRHITRFRIHDRGEVDQGTHFAVAKTGVNRLELEIVRCVLAPPERVCLEIMS